MPLQPQPFTSPAQLLPAGKAGHGEELGWEWPRGSITWGLSGKAEVWQASNTSR